MRVDSLQPCRDVLLIRPRTFRDARGSFRELFHLGSLEEVGLSFDTVQVNYSRSLRGVLRGLHFQQPGGQAKLMAVTNGRIFDVAVDVRANSPTFGRWVGHELTSEGGEQMFIPEGFAHGFLVLSDVADVVYACSAPYEADVEHCLAWNDERVQISWPLEALAASDPGHPAPILSRRDLEGLSLGELEAGGWLPGTTPKAP